MITDGIRANDLHSYHDFDLCIKHRKISLPKKKIIQQTVPFMNGYYDFSALNGSPVWESRTVSYIFDIMGDTPEETEAYLDRVLDWVCNVHEVDIFDDTMPDYHWHGSYESSDPNWDESGMAVELTVNFICYPFKIANNPTTANLSAGTHTIVNTGMTVAPIAYSDSVAAIQLGNYVQSIPAGVSVKLSIDLERGNNTVTIAGDSPVKLKFYKEVM